MAVKSDIGIATFLEVSIILILLLGSSIAKPMKAASGQEVFQLTRIMINRCTSDEQCLQSKCCVTYHVPSFRKQYGFCSVNAAEGSPCSPYKNGRKPNCQCGPHLYCSRNVVRDARLSPKFVCKPLAQITEELERPFA